MGSNNENSELKLNDELIKIIKQYADLVKDANGNKYVGPHIDFRRYEEYKEVRFWFESFINANLGDEQRKNLIRIFSTRSDGKGSQDAKIRSLYGLENLTGVRLINAIMRTGNLSNWLKTFNNIKEDIDYDNKKLLDGYIDKMINKISNEIYEKVDGNRIKFKDKSDQAYSSSKVFKELLFLLNIKEDAEPLENGCKETAMKFILETQNFKKVKKNDAENDVIETIINFIEQNTDQKIPKYLKLDQFFNVIHKIKYSDIEGIKENGPLKEFYVNMNKYFMTNSLSYKNQKDFMEILIKNKNTILHGPPGTGKTYQITQYLQDNANKEEYRYIVFHPNYGYEDFIDGIKPTKFVGGQIKLELVNGHFKQFCLDKHKANKDFIEKKKKEEHLIKDNKKAKIDLPKYYFVVDEINRANLSTVFGETLMLLEDSYRYKYFNEDGGEIDNQMNKDAGRLITLKNSTLCEEEKHWFEKIGDDEVLFGIPENIYFIGMMNDVDKSVDLFDLALRRRFAWIERGYDETVIMKELGLDDKDKYLNGIKNLNKFLSDNLGSSSFQLGHSYFLKVKNPSDKNVVKELFDNHIKPLIKEYLRTEYPENEIQGKLDEAQKEFLKPYQL